VTSYPDYDTESLSSQGQIDRVSLKPIELQLFVSQIMSIGSYYIRYIFIYTD